MTFEHKNKPCYPFTASHTNSLVSVRLDLNAAALQQRVWSTDRGVAPFVARTAYTSAYDV